MSEVIEVDFKPKGDTDDIGIRIKRRTFSECRHQNVIIDEELRAVGCQDCGERLDPVQVLIGWGTNWERYANALRHLIHHGESLNREIADLNRQRKNLKAQIRRLTEKVG